MGGNLLIIIHLYVDMMKKFRGYPYIHHDNDIKGGKQESRGAGNEHGWQLS